MIETCTRCELHKLLPAGCTPIPGVGNTKADFMFVIDSPSKPDVLQSELLSDRVGKYFYSLLDKSEIGRENVYISSLVHCWPTNKNKDRLPNKSEIDLCKVWLWQELKKIQPKVIFTMGSLVSNALGKPVFKKKQKLEDIVGNYYKLDYIDSTIFPCYSLKYIMTRSKEVEQDYINILNKGSEHNDTCIRSRECGDN